MNKEPGWLEHSPQYFGWHLVIGFPQHRFQDSVLAVGSAGRGLGQQPKPLSVALSQGSRDLMYFRC